MTKSKGIYQERSTERVSFRLALDKEINSWIIHNKIANKTKFINEVLREYIEKRQAEK